MGKNEKWNKINNKVVKNSFVKEIEIMTERKQMKQIVLKLKKFFLNTTIGKIIYKIYSYLLIIKISRFCGFSLNKVKNKCEKQSSLDIYLTTKLKIFMEDQTNLLEFPIYENPIISIIIVNYNQVSFLNECLNSILLNVKTPYEVIIIDNNSSSITLEFLARLKNINLILENENLDFILGNNKAAIKSNGKYLYFLNNDTYIAKNCIETMVNTFLTDKDIGIVGSKIIRTNGKLQEAGCIVWNNGEVEAYGKNSESPFDYKFNYVRTVDFCSGASLMIKKDVFASLGGFSKEYYPAYYEDADICLRCVKIGKKVVYQPNSIIIHKENGNVSGRAKKLTKKNLPIFLKNHKNYLNRIPKLNSIIKQRDIRNGKRILFIEDQLPDVIKGAGQPRTKAFLDMLISEGFVVSFFPLQNSTAPHDILKFYQQKGVEVFDSSYQNALFFYDRKSLFDYILVSRPHNASKVYNLLKWLFPNTKLIYDAEALFYCREIAKSEYENKPLNLNLLNQLKQNEMFLIKSFDTILTVSEKEKQLIETNIKHKNIFVWSMPYKSRIETPPFSKRQDLLYVGGLTPNNQPNVDAMLFFLSKVFPALLKIKPDIKLHLAGNFNSENLLPLMDSRVVRHGPVKNCELLFDSSKIFICPQPYGAGISLKLLEAISNGLPCIASPTAANSLPEGENGVLIANNELDYVNAILNLDNNEELWQTLRINNLKYIDANFSYSSLHLSFKKIFYNLKQ